MNAWNNKTEVKVTATGLKPRNTQFVNEHSTIWPNWPNFNKILTQEVV